jgi:DNA-binding CsgD family transcriptional regulator
MQAPFADPLSDSTPGAQRLPLVGREPEMSVVRALLECVAFDRPAGARALMISGEVGIGKSRLLDEMQHEALARSFRVLDSRVYEYGGSIPYLPFIEALRPVIRSTPLETLREYMGLSPLDAAHKHDAGSGSGENASSVDVSLSLAGAPMLTALARLFPELPGALHAATITELLSSDQEKFRLFDAVATLLERMAEDRPVLLSIDNLQWADSASLELTMYLTVRLHRSRVALAGATRPPGASRAGAPPTSDDVASAAMAIRTLGELVRQGMLTMLPLGPLAAGATEHYLRVLLPGDIPGNLASSLHTRAEGNPFFLEELVRMLAVQGQLLLRDGVWRASQPIGSPLPESIFRAVEQRLQGLSLPCQERLRAASLFGRAFPLAALAAILREAEAKTQLFIDEAIQAGVLAHTPSTQDRRWDEGMGEEGMRLRDVPVLALPSDYIFRQGIVQEVLLSQVPAYRARELHGEIGAALEALYGSQAPAAELAYHYTLGELRRPALRWSILAGENALRQQAYREAIDHFHAALRWLDGRSSPAADEDLPAQAQLYLWIGQSWFKVGDLKQALQAFQQALEHQQSGERGQPAQPHRLLLAQTNRLMSDIYRMQGKYEQAVSHLRAASQAVAQIQGQEAGGEHRSNTTEQILLLQAQATLDLFMAQPKLAEQALWQSHQLAVGIGDRESQAFALHLIGWTRGWGAHIHEAIRYQEQAHALYTAIGDPFRSSLVDQGLGIIYLALGEVEQARLHNLRGIERARRYGVRPALGWLYFNQAIMALVEGNWQACESSLRQAMQEAESTENARLKPVVMEAQAEMRFRRGDWRLAEEQFLGAIQASMHTEWHQSAMALYGHFLAVTGRRAAAKAQLERAAALPEASGFSGYFYIPFLAEGFLHLGSSAQATKYIERIRDLHGFMYFGVAVDRILGQVAVLEGDWETAERAFEDALALCRRVHNQPEEAAILYEQACAALLRSGQQPSPGSFTHIQALCARARELFLQYDMSRAAEMVDTLLEGMRQLKVQERVAVPARKPGKAEPSPYAYHLDLQLTRREQEVLCLVAEGYTDREVAETLIISHRTVNRHLSNIFVKLDVPGRAAAVAYAIRQGMVG